MEHVNARGPRAAGGEVNDEVDAVRRAGKPSASPRRTGADLCLNSAEDLRDRRAGAPPHAGHDHPDASASSKQPGGSMHGKIDPNHPVRVDSPILLFSISRLDAARNLSEFSPFLRTLLVLAPANGLR